MIPRLIIAYVFLAIISVSAADAECKNCDKLKKSSFLGIKQIKRYLDKSSKVKIYSSEKRAKKEGLEKFNGCLEGSTVSKKKSICKPAFAVSEDGFYLCPNQLKPFKTEIAAQSADYLPFTGCENAMPTPAPTATPQVSPKPFNRTIAADDGIRFSGVDAVAVVRLANGNFRSYSSAGITSFEPDTIRYADSTDGLTFGSKTAITGTSPESQETFANPSLVVSSNGSIVKFYEEVKHISSAGLELHNLYRAVSQDGVSFSRTPDFVAIPGGSVISNYFYPAMLMLGAEKIRLYYSDTLGIKTLTSDDLGLNFSEAESVVIAGRSDNYAPFPSNINVVKEQSGNYLMFFNSQADSINNSQSIFMAESNDGIFFHIYDRPILSSTSELSYVDPNAVVQTDGSIRIYYIERSGSGQAVTRSVKSLKLTS